jgi:hypothetical protein
MMMMMKSLRRRNQLKEAQGLHGMEVDLGEAEQVHVKEWKVVSTLEY